MSHNLVSCSEEPFQFVVDLDNTPINSVADTNMTSKDRGGLALLLDAEMSLLPQQRTLFQVDMDGDLQWVKLRPAAREFLDKLAAVGQISVFTMATAYV